MKKALFGGFVFLFVSCVSAKPSEVEKKDLPDFENIHDIASNKDVQDNVRVLQYKLLQLVDSINKPQLKQGEETKGSRQDIEKAQDRIKYLVALEVALKEAKNLDRIQRMIGLNTEGRNDVGRAKALIESIKNVETFSKLKEIPGLSKQIRDEIERLEELEKRVIEADDLEKIKKIPTINATGVNAINELEKENKNLHNIDTAGQIVATDQFPEKLRNEVAALIKQDENLQNATSLELLGQVANVNRDVIKNLQQDLNSYKQLKEEHKQLKEKYRNQSEQLKNINEVHEQDARFNNLLVSVLLRALIGFEYRTQSFDFAALKAKRVIDKTALVAAAKNNISHMGGSQEDLYTLTSEIEEILKIILVSRDWKEQLDVVSTKLAHIKKICDSLNSDADMIRLNIDYALEILDRLTNDAGKPPRDNVPNVNTIKGLKAEDQSKETSFLDKVKEKATQLAEGGISQKSENKNSEGKTKSEVEKTPDNLATKNVKEKTTKQQEKSKSTSEKENGSSMLSKITSNLKGTLNNIKKGAEKAAQSVSDKYQEMKKEEKKKKAERKIKEAEEKIKNAEEEIKKAEEKKEKAEKKIKKVENKDSGKGK